MLHRHPVAERRDPKGTRMSVVQGVVTQQIREARENRGHLLVLRLDRTNVYGSIPHKLVEMAVKRHHLPGKFRDLIVDYSNSFS